MFRNAFCGRQMQSELLSELQNICISVIPFCFSKRRNQFIYTFDENLSLRVHKCSQEEDEIGHRLMHCISKYTRMQVSGWAMYSQLVVR